MFSFLAIQFLSLFFIHEGLTAETAEDANSCAADSNECNQGNKDISYVTIPFGGAVDTIYNLNTIKEILDYPSENELIESYNPNWGKLGIAMVAIYGVRNARLCIQHYQGTPESLIELLKTDTYNIDGNVPSTYDEMLLELTNWENELFTSFYYWNQNSNDNNKWQNFISNIYRIYGSNINSNENNFNSLRKYRRLFMKQSHLDTWENNNDFEKYSSKIPVLTKNNLNYGISTELFNENKNGRLDSKFVLDKTMNGQFDPNSIIITETDGNDGNNNNKVNIPNIKLNNGLSVPLVGFGSWPLTGDACYNALMLAIKNGYRLIDTSQNYNNEEIIGKVIKDSIEKGYIKDRSEIIIADKISFNKDFGNATQQTRNAFMEQLEKLGTDYIDVYMIHGPIGDRERLKQAWYTMEELYFEGKIKTLAISNYNMWELKELLNYARVVPAFLQTKFDVFTQGSQAPWVDTIRPLLQEYDIYLQGYCIQNEWPGKLAAIKDFHVRYMARNNYASKTETQLLMRWAYQNGIMMLVRSSDEYRQIENVNIFDFKISDTDMQLLNGLITMYSPFRVSWMNDIYLLEERVTD